MAFLLDTSILLRLANTSDVQHSLATKAVATLHRRQETLYITAQNLIEFRHGATRPVQHNGLGLSATAASQEAAKLEALFPLLSETPAIYQAWRILADSLSIMGKPVHDTRLVAVCHVHGITHILPFNVRDFLRFQGVGPGLAVVDPNAV